MQKKSSLLSALLSVITLALLLCVATTTLASDAQYDYTLKLDKSHHVRINYAKGIMCRFIPDEDGVYLFQSDAYNKDTLGVLYSADMSILAQDDDSGEDENFLIAHSLKGGETYYIHIKFADPDLTGYFYAKVTKSPVASIDVEPLALNVETNGYFTFDYDAKTGEFSPEYYYYEWQQYINYTVNMTDGSQIEGSGIFFTYNDIQYDISFDTVQNYANRWSAGESYTATASLLGAADQVDISIKETPVQSISVDPIAITEYTNGYYISDDNGYNSGYQYIWSDFVDCTVTMKDGTVIENVKYGFEYDGNWYDLRYCDNQSADNIWQAGGHYTASVSVLGCSSSVSVCIKPTQIASVWASGLVFDEHTHGDYFYEHPKHVFDNTREYYYYQWFYEVEYTVTMSDGTVINAKGCEFDYGDETYYLQWSDNQCYDNQWRCGEYTAQMSIQGVSCDVSVTIIPEGLKLEDGNLVFYTNGERARNQWILLGDLWFYFDQNGYAVKNQWIKDSVGWCYLGSTGIMQTNRWVQDSVGWCYVGADGYCVTNCWMQDSVGWCYLGSDGRMVTNSWIKDSVGWCYVGADGYCLTNCWVQDSIGWCYLDSEGRMVYDQWVKDSNGWCYIGTDGYWQP